MKNRMNSSEWFFWKIPLLALLLAQWLSEIKITVFFQLLFTLQLKCTGSFHSTFRHPAAMNLWTDTEILTGFLNEACCSAGNSCICTYVCHIVLFYELVLFKLSFSSPFLHLWHYITQKICVLPLSSLYSLSPFFLCSFITAFFLCLKLLHISSQLSCLHNRSHYLLFYKPTYLCISSLSLLFLSPPFPICRQYHGAGVSGGPVVSSANRGRQHRGRIRGGSPSFFMINMYFLFLSFFSFWCLCFHCWWNCHGYRLQINKQRMAVCESNEREKVLCALVVLHWNNLYKFIMLTFLYYIILKLY